MSAVDDLIAARKGSSPQASSGGSAVDALIASRKGGGSATPENAFLAKGKQVGTGIGKALDAQRWAAAKLATGESDTDRQMTKEREMVGTQGAYEALGKIPGVGHFLQGTSDVIQQTVTDPLTYETLGAGPALRALGIAGKIGPAALKAIDATPVGRKLYDFTHWGGEVERERPGTDVFLRGAANKASSTGKSMQDRMVYYFDQATKPLSDGDRVTVGQALNGEVSAEDLNSTQRRAFNQLRRLTEYDYAQRAAVAQKINFTALTKDMPVADRAELWKHLQANTEPKIPNPERIPKPRGPGSEVKYRSAVPGKQPGPEINWLAVYKQAFDGLSDTERRAVQDAAGRGYVEEGLAPELVDRLRVLKKAGEADLEDVKQGLGDVPKISPKRPYTLPYKNQAAIDRAKALNEKYWDVKRHVEESIPRRENYMPWTHTAQELAENKGTKAAEFNPIERTDPRTEERKEVKVDAPEQLKAGFDAMSANTGRQVQRGVLHDALGDFVDDPKIKELFKQTLKATGDERADTQKITDAWLNLVGYPRAATVSLTPRHAANILDLAMNTVPLDKQPKFFADTMALAKKIVSANPREYARLTQEGRDLGAISGSFTERKPFFQKFADWMPGIGGKSTGALGAYTRLNNKLVWAVDEAAKTQYAKILKEMHPELGDLGAGGTASKRLVDYEHVSPMVKALRYVAPFGTFRGSIPGAVAGGIARNPARAAFLNRATGGTMYGGKPDKGQHGVTLYNPTADIGRGLDAPQDFLRGTLGAPVQGAATLGLEAATGNPGASIRTMGQELKDLPGQIMRGQFSKIGTPGKVSPYAKAVALRTAHYLNYQNPIDLRFLTDWAASGVPEAQAVLELLGMSQFTPPKGGITPESIGKEAIRQGAGINIK